MKNLRKFLFLLCVCFALVGCEKVVIDEEAQGNPSDIVSKGECRITLNAMQVEQTPFYAPDKNSTATQSVADVCSRISFVIFDGDTKVSSTHQSSSDKSFGTVSVNLDKGTYTLVIIAHNGLGTPTFTSPSKISFKDNKVTDTFYYCQPLVVGESSNYELILSRAVAMFNLVVNDDTPSDVKRMKFYYTGGSSTFNAIEGCGCVDSRQTEYREVPETAYKGKSEYCVYTFPRGDGRKLKMDVTAFDSSGENSLYRQVFENVPVSVNQVTRYTGYFFGGDSFGGQNSISVKMNDVWTYANYDY